MEDQADEFLHWNKRHWIALFVFCSGKHYT